ncbi:MAG: hypothetical protein V4484_08790 [Pseudomonadota bacterium]
MCNALIRLDKFLAMGFEVRAFDTRACGQSARRSAAFAPRTGSKRRRTRQGEHRIERSSNATGGVRGTSSMTPRRVFSAHSNALEPTLDGAIHALQATKNGRAKWPREPENRDRKIRLAGLDRGF